MNDCCLISEAGARSSLCCFIRFHVEKKEPYRAALGWEAMEGVLVQVCSKVEAVTESLGSLPSHLAPVEVRPGFRVQNKNFFHMQLYL